MADLASQEAARLRLEEARRNTPAAQAAGIDMDAGALNVPFLGNRVLDLANRGQVNLERAQIGAAVMDQVTQRSGRMEAMRLALSRARSGKNAPEERARRKGGGEAPLEQSSRMMMSGFIKGCWGTLWISFGHTVYLLDLLFIAQAGSSHLRQYIPSVGEEWFPPQALKRLPKSTILPIKLAEICALFILTGLVFTLDLILLIAVTILVAALGSVASSGF